MVMRLKLWHTQIALVLFAIPLPLHADDVLYERDVAPILEQNCLHCHGEDEQESGLRLDQRASLLRGGDSGLAALVPGNPKNS